MLLTKYEARRAAAGDDITKGPSFDMKLEALQPVLRGEIPLKAHAHRADDICTAIRIAKEFGGAHHRALHRGSPDCRSAGPGGLSCGGGSNTHQRQQDRAGEQDFRPPRHPGVSRPAGEHHHRCPGDPAAVPAALRRAGR